MRYGKRPFTRSNYKWTRGSPEVPGYVPDLERSVPERMRWSRPEKVNIPSDIQRPILQPEHYKRKFGRRWRALPKDLPKAKPELIGRDVKVASPTKRPRGRPRKPKMSEMNFKISHKHQLTTGKDKKAKLFGSLLKSYSVGSATNSKYHSTAESNVSSALKASLSNSQRIIFQTKCYYDLQSTVQLQAYSDMSYGTSPAPYNTAPTYPWSACIWGGDISGATNNLGSLHAMYEMVPNQTSSGRVFYENCMVDTTIQNQSTNNIIVDLFECIAKRDLVSNPDQNGVLVYSPSYAWSSFYAQTQAAYTGLPQSTGSVAGNNSKILPTNILARPWDSELFNQYWRIASHIQLEMSAGSTHIHRSEYNLNKMLSYYLWTNSSIITGVSRNIMIVVRGTPGTTAPGNSTPNIAGVMAASVTVNHDIVYHAKCFNYSVILTQYADTVNETNLTSGGLNQVDSDAVATTNSGSSNPLQ